MEAEEELRLGFIRLIGEESDGYYRYEFIFTDNIEEFWLDNGEHKPCCLVNDLQPIDDYVTEVQYVKMKIKLEVIQDNCCFGFQDCTDGIVALGWSDNIQLNDLYFMFGDSKSHVEDKLTKHNILFGTFWWT